MAHSLSQKKRVRQNAKRKMINRSRKSQVKTQTKKFEVAVAAGELEKCEQEFRATVKRLDKVASTSTMHKRTAARKKSRLARQLNKLKAQVQ